MSARILAVMAALIASPALAQQPQVAPVTVTGSSGEASPAVEKRIVELKSKLAITAAQEPQWGVFAGVMRQNALHMTQLSAGRTAQAGTLKGPDEIRGYAEVARAHADDLTRLVAPFDALYAVMSPEQQVLADRALSRPTPGTGQARRK